MCRTVSHTRMKKDNDRKNVCNDSLTRKIEFREEIEKHSKEMFSLPETQKINVNHPPIMYLIETVFESIKFVSAVQLRVIDCH